VKPVLLELGEVVVPSYTVLMAAGAFLLMLRAAKDAENLGVPWRGLLRVLVAAYVSGWLGARLFFVMEHRGLLPGPVWERLADPSLGGFSSYGGILAGSACAVLFARISRMPPLAVLDAGAVGLCLFGIPARLGCFLAGCCHGSPTSLPWGLVFPAGSPASLRYGQTPVHPSQLYEAALLALLATVLALRPSHFPGERFLRLAAFYSGARLLLDSLRGDAAGPHRLLGTAQWISICVLVASLSLMFVARGYRWKPPLSASRE